MKNHPFVFFGTPELSVHVLDKLETSGYVPTLIITAPDKPQGRKMLVTPPPVKEWARARDIDCWQPEHVKDPSIIAELTNTEWEFFVVAAYGQILPKELIDIPKHGVLNVHPSLLPRFRGPSPVRSQILENEKVVGVSIMLLDEEMDHGPILAQARIEPEEWPISGSLLENILFDAGGELLAETIPEWITGKITPEEQDHSKATVTKKLTKEDGRIDLADDPYQNYLKINALDGWPGTYFFAEKNGKEIRVKIVDAAFENGILTILRVIPEGKKEMDYSDFCSQN